MHQACDGRGQVNRKQEKCLLCKGVGHLGFGSQRCPACDGARQVKCTAFPPPRLPHTSIFYIFFPLPFFSYFFSVLLISVHRAPYRFVTRRQIACRVCQATGAVSAGLLKSAKCKSCLGRCYVRKPQHPCKICGGHGYVVEQRPACPTPVRGGCENQRCFFGGRPSQGASPTLPPPW